MKLDMKCEWCDKDTLGNHLWSEGFLCDDCSDKFCTRRLILRQALRPDIWGHVGT